MSTYEIRLLNDSGASVLVYTANCASDEHAKETLRKIDLPYARFEIWHDLERVMQGEREPVI